MTSQRLFVVLSALNAVLLIALLLAYVRPGDAQTVPILRGRGLEIVDDAGRVRAAISILQPATANGVTTAETVILRLIDPKGRPTIKIAGSVEGGGMSIVGDTDQTYAILKADQASSLMLLEKDGRRTVLGP